MGSIPALRGNSEDELKLVLRVHRYARDVHWCEHRHDTPDLKSSILFACTMACVTAGVVTRLSSEEDGIETHTGYEGWDRRLYIRLPVIRSAPRTERPTSINTPPTKDRAPVYETGRPGSIPGGGTIRRARWSRHRLQPGREGVRFLYGVPLQRVRRQERPIPATTQGSSPSAATIEM